MTAKNSDGAIEKWFRVDSPSPQVVNGDEFLEHATDYYTLTPGIAPINDATTRKPPNIPTVEVGGLYVTGPQGVVRNEPAVILPDWFLV
jgi:hypothetical protein